MGCIKSGEVKTVAGLNRTVEALAAFWQNLSAILRQVGWERGAQAGKSAGPGSAFPVEGGRAHDVFLFGPVWMPGEAITHQVVDRPAGSFEVRPGRGLISPATLAMS